LSFSPIENECEGKMNKIIFSHLYDKLLNKDEEAISFAILLSIHIVSIENISSYFKDYDTDRGKYILPDRGKFLLLIFEKCRSIDTWTKSRNLFTTLRSYTDDKEKYYQRKIGERFEIIIK
jgi:hypothetical protein